MADSDAVKQLGKAARSGFKTPNAKNFDEARSGAMQAMDAPMAPAAPPSLFAPQSAPSAKPSAMASPSAMAEDDQLQALSDAQERQTGRPMTLEEAKAALQRRSQMAAPQVYPSIER